MKDTNFVDLVYEYIRSQLVKDDEWIDMNIHLSKEDNLVIVDIFDKTDMNVKIEIN